MSILGAVVVPHPPLILHEVGRGEEIKIQKTIDAYDAAMQTVASLEPETVVVISPHSTVYRDHFHISPGFLARGDLSMFGSPEVSIEVEYDQDLAKEIIRCADLNELPSGTTTEPDFSLDHATIVPLYFLNKYLSNYKVVRISPSGLSADAHYSFGGCLQLAAKSINKNIVVIASGDLSHKLLNIGPYGYAEEGPLFDEALTEILQNGTLKDLLDMDLAICEAAGECGLKPFQMMAGALSGKRYSHDLLSYEGPFGVGYAVATFEVSEYRLEKDYHDDYVRLAKSALENYVITGRKIKVPEETMADLLSCKAGVFVSLHENGALRGCIGTISSTTNSIAEEIIQNAIAAGAHDPRFMPVKEHALDKLDISVDVLKDAEPIESYNDLDVKKYGVIVQKGSRKGLLLPNLEGIDTVLKQIDIARQKAGISPDEEFTVYRFEVVRHK